jgi:hypothetical protein
MPTTTLTPEQIAEAQRFLKAEAEEKWKAECAKIRARLDTLAVQAVTEALACPGVESAEKDDRGCYFNGTGIRVRYTGERKDGTGGWIGISLDGYTAEAPPKIRAKVRPGYKTGSRTFKSIASAVRSNRKFVLDIEAAVDAQMKARGEAR